MSSTPSPQQPGAASVYRETAAESAQPADDRGAEWAWVDSSPGKLAQAAGFGLIFGFLLQKGGVAKFDLLIGVLLLQEFTVVKVMGTAIAVGMVGAYVLRWGGLIELQIHQTVYGANILGGLIFGVGFGLLAYCPGTNATAVGQGNYDAIVGLAGLLLGSYLFALRSDRPERIRGWGQRGELTLPQLLGVSPGLFIAGAVPVLILILVVVELYAPF